ncbi:MULTISPECIES: DUF6058 family natural product biosynthesis protein [Micromonospora]|uniref:DUF6058 family natural product biosynthesis protein n=1 Tax=Micromonospora TaxID=1873 RepID=UPI0034DFD8DC
MRPAPGTSGAAPTPAPYGRRPGRRRPVADRPQPGSPAAPRPADPPTHTGPPAGDHACPTGRAGRRVGGRSARLHALVDELDALEPAFTGYDRLRFGGPTSRDSCVDAVRARYPRCE